MSLERSHPKQSRNEQCGAQQSVLLFGSPLRLLLVLHLVLHQGTESPAQACRHALAHTHTHTHTHTETLVPAWSSQHIFPISSIF